MVINAVCIWFLQSTPHRTPTSSSYPGHISSYRTGFADISIQQFPPPPTFLVRISLPLISTSGVFALCVEFEFKFKFEFSADFLTKVIICSFLLLRYSISCFSDSIVSLSVTPLTCFSITTLCFFYTSLAPPDSTFTSSLNFLLHSSHSVFRRSIFRLSSAMVSLHSSISSTNESTLLDSSRFFSFMACFWTFKLSNESWFACDDALELCAENKGNSVLVDFN